MTATEPTAILFDLDGVIVDSESLHHRAYDAALAPYGVSSIPFEVYAERFSNRGVGLEYCASQVPGLDLVSFKTAKHKHFRALLEADARPLPGVVEVIRGLAASFSLAVATGSSRDVATFVLDRFGLKDCFRAVIGREDYERDKPEPDAFQHACAALGERAERCVVVEDSYKGLCAALAAGMTCIVVPNDYTRGGDFSRAAAVLQSIRDLTPTRAVAIHRNRA